LICFNQHVRFSGLANFKKVFGDKHQIFQVLAQSSNESDSMLNAGLAVKLLTKPRRFDCPDNKRSDK
jgi:hypothetical protein